MYGGHPLILDWQLLTADINIYARIGRKMSITTTVGWLFIPTQELPRPSLLWSGFGCVGRFARRLAAMAHCCAKNLRLSAIFRHSNAPRTQFCAPAMHCCAEKLQPVASFPHSNALLTHTGCVTVVHKAQHLHTQCTLYLQISIVCAPCTYSVHCKGNHQWLIQCALILHSPVIAHIVYTVSAFIWGGTLINSVSEKQMQIVRCVCIATVGTTADAYMYVRKLHVDNPKFKCKVDVCTYICIYLYGS